MSTPFQTITFSTRTETITRFLDALATLMPTGRSFAVLDLGCGTGGLAIAIAAQWPEADVLGLDISPNNIATAKVAAAKRGLSNRVCFRCADFFSDSVGPFDLVVADSVLQLLSVSDDVLASKLIGSLRPDGLLVAAMPDDSRGNAVRVLARRLWSMTPRGLDRLALAVARKVYPDVPATALADRLPYLRLSHARAYGADFASALTASGLVRGAVQPWPSDSVAKPAHKLIIYSKPATAA